MAPTEQLLDRVASGDATAVDELMAQFRERLRRMVSVRLDPRLATRLDASDVVQEIMARAAVQLSDYVQTRPISFYPWLRQLAWNQLIDLYRHHVLASKRTIERDERPPAISDASVEWLARSVVAGGTSPTRQVLRKELRERVREAIDALPEPYREVLIMRHLEQLSINEVAEIAEISLGTVKSRLFRGIERLQQLLEKPYGESNHE